MDLVPIPTGHLAHRPIEVQRLRDERFLYDNKGLSEFPARSGINLSSLAAQEDSIKEAIAPLLQTWLWFGLLREIFDICDKKHVLQIKQDPDVFTCISADGEQMISASKLPEIVARVATENRRLLDDERDVWKYDACLKTAADETEYVLSGGVIMPLAERERNYDMFPHSFTTLLSIQLLIEFLWTARGIFFPQQDRSILADSYIAQQLNLSPVDLVLRRSGWPAQLIADLPKSYMFRYFVSFFHPPRFFKAPKSPGKKRIEPTHATPACQCEKVSIDPSRIESIAKANQLALVSFDDDATCDKLSITKVSQDDIGSSSLQFVAISHVRSAGLGNASAHSLPSCQLSSLQEQVQQCIGTSRETISFWIDTICLPLHREARKRMLPYVQKVYRHATKVLVVDPVLTRTTSGTQQECLMRIRYSLWKQRLWTLQEGALARALCFCFKDGVRELSTLIQQYEAAASPWALLLPVLGESFDDEAGRHGALALFDSDLKATRHLDRQRDAKSGVILRLGYLSFSRYRYFIEEREQRNIASVLKILQQVYATGVNQSEEEWLKFEQRVRRVNTMVSIQVEEIHVL